MRILTVLAICAAFLALVLSMPYDSPGQTKWFILSALSALIVGNEVIRPRLGAAAALFFGYVVVNGAWFWIWKNNRYVSVQPYDQLALRYYAADGIAKLLICLMPVIFLLRDRDTLMFWGRKLSALFCLLSTGMVYFSFFFEPGWCGAVNSCGGALSNPSMNASLIVVTLPFLMAMNRGWAKLLFVGLVVGAVILSKGSVAIGLLAALACLCAIVHGYRWILALAPLSLGAGYLLFGASLFDSNGRVFMWRFFMDKWASSQGNWAFGTGYGTFGVFSANLQLEAKLIKDWWIWMHNDWLEILFTLGAVGLVLAMAVYLTALLRFYARKEHTEAVALSLFGLMMGMNYPLHHPIAALFGAFIVLSGLAVLGERDKEHLDYLRHNC